MVIWWFRRWFIKSITFSAWIDEMVPIAWDYHRTCSIVSPYRRVTITNVTWIGSTSTFNNPYKKECSVFFGFPTWKALETAIVWHPKWPTSAKRHSAHIHSSAIARPSWIPRCHVPCSVQWTSHPSNWGNRAVVRWRPGSIHPHTPWMIGSRSVMKIPIIFPIFPICFQDVPRCFRICSYMFHVFPSFSPHVLHYFSYLLP